MVVLGRWVKNRGNRKTVRSAASERTLAMQQSHVACAPARGDAGRITDEAVLAVASEIVDKGPTATPSLTILIGVVEQSHE